MTRCNGTSPGNSVLSRRRNLRNSWCRCLSWHSPTTLPCNVSSAANRVVVPLPTPDLVIYLQATPEVLKKRLKKKNAPGEKAINDEYLEEVVKAYEHFFFHYTSSDLLIVNTSEIDFVEHSEDLQALLRRVSEPIRGTQYFLPLGSDENTKS